MRITQWAFFAVSVFLSTGVFASELVDIDSKFVFAPVGFDTNDEVVVTLDGYLPDTCFKLAEPEVTVNDDTKKIIVQAKAREVTGPCFDVTVPFTKTVRVGVLSAGEYSVFSNRGQKMETISISTANNPGPDDFMYAPIDNAWITPEGVTLEGRFTDTCMTIHEVIVQNHGKTLEILPIVRLSSLSLQGGACEPAEIPFQKKVALPKTSRGRHLVHVRTLNGHSLNVAFTAP